MPKINGSKTQTTPPKPEKEKKRPVVYPEVKCLIFSSKIKGGNPLTAQHAKDFLGWTVVTTGDYDLIDQLGNKVRFANNLRNRSFKPIPHKMLIQVILERQWQFNLEAMIIGKTGLTISCQHRLAALVCAVQEWEKDKEAWPKWKTAPTLECIINVGAEETDAVVNTIDTGVPRVFSDVIYRSEYFRKYPPIVREKLAVMTERAVQVVEHRTNARKDAFAPKRPHAEGLDFLDRHLKILECVKHIAEEDGSKKGIGYFLPVGYAAGLMYLMATGNTQPEAYASEKSEKACDLSNMDFAATFFVELAQGNPKLAAVREEASEILRLNQRITRLEAFALLIKAWMLWSEGKPVKRDAIALQWDVDESGVRRLREFPKLGGIDVGEIDLLASIQQEEDEPELTEEQIEANKAQVRKDALAKMKGKPFKPKHGDTVFLLEDGGVIEGTVQEIYATPKGGMIARIMMPNNKETEAPVKDLLPYNPQQA